MSIATKNTKLEKGFGPPILITQVKDHNDDPFVLKKVQKAKDTLIKVGLPNVKK
jgi:hypothetical protein